MARFRVFDTETANQLIPRLSHADTVDFSDAGEYFSADSGEVILAPSVKSGEVLYIKIRAFTPATSAARSAAPERSPEPPKDVDLSPTPPASVPLPDKSSPKHYVASGFLGLDGDIEEEVPEAPKPWWKRLID